MDKFLSNVIADCGCVHHAEEGTPCKHDLRERAAVEALQTAYMALLQMPDSLVRIRNQEALCVLRDAIAKATGVDVQEVQESFESMALQVRLAA